MIYFLLFMTLPKYLLLILRNIISLYPHICLLIEPILPFIGKISRLNRTTIKKDLLIILKQAEKHLELNPKVVSKIEELSM
jgi:hypothetical protein